MGAGGQVKLCSTTAQERAAQKNQDTGAKGSAKQVNRMRNLLGHQYIATQVLYGEAKVDCRATVTSWSCPLVLEIITVVHSYQFCN
jgi:hypothetical protein